MRTTDPRWTRHADTGPTIEMAPDGTFVDVRRSGAIPFGTKAAAIAVVVAVLAGAVSIALLALWLALTLIPIAIGGALIAYGVVRTQMWWTRRHSLGGKRDLYRP